MIGAQPSRPSSAGQPARQLINGIFPLSSPERHHYGLNQYNEVGRHRGGPSSGGVVVHNEWIHKQRLTTLALKCMEFPVLQALESRKGGKVGTTSNIGAIIKLIISFCSHLSGPAQMAALCTVMIMMLL